MNTYNNLYSMIYSLENLYNAYLKARKNKRYHEDVLEFSANLEENLIQLQNELIHKTYEPGRYKEFYVYDPKTRLVMAAPFKDRVLHHAICNVIEPIFERSFIYHSFACRIGKGTHAGIRCTVKYLRRAVSEHESMYCFKADISKYFPSIHHNILRQIIRKKIRCKETLWLLDKILDSTAKDGDTDPVGLPIGNLTSQLFANIYLTQLDYFMKNQRRIKYYVRYMDDFIVLYHNKKYLHSLWHDTEEFLDNHLGLSMNHKTSIFPVSQGIDFLGYRIWPDYKLLRKTNVKRIKRIIKKLVHEYHAGNILLSKVQAVLASWLGHASYADVYYLRKKIKTLGEVDKKR